MKRFLSSFFFFLFSVTLFGQEFKLMLDEQLSSKLIKDIYQDTDGFVWITTDNGLNRYDGNKIRIYNHIENDSTSLCNNLVISVFEDGKGHVYVGSYKGMQLYEKKTDSFPVHATFRDGRLFDETVNGFCELPDGRVCSFGDNTWILNAEDDRLVVDSLHWDIPGTDIYRIGCDNEDYIWALKRNVGLYRIKNNKSQLICEYNNSEFSTYDFRIAGGRVYIISTQNDIFRFLPGPNRIEKLNTEPISTTSVRDICQYDEKSLIVCTDGNGIKSIDCISGKVSDLQVNIPFLSSNHLKVHKAIFDSVGNFWIGLYQKGVAMISTSQSMFGYYGYKSLLNNIIGNSTISSLCQDDKKNLWVGTDGDGLYKINASGTESKHYASQSDGGTIPSIIKNLILDSEGNLWISSYGNGCGCFDTKAERYSSFEKIFSRFGKAANRIYDIVEDNEKRIWLASLGAGTFCYDLKSNQLIEELSFYKEVNAWQTCLLHTSDNRLLIGTFNGLFSVDLNKENPTPELVSERTAINTLFEDSEGKIWIGDNDGLCYIGTNGDVCYLTPEQGVPVASVNSINEDSRHTLWLATNNGIINYNPDNQTSSRYTAADGLKCTEFSKMHSFTDDNGQIWFAGDYGITFFDPIALEHPESSDFHIRLVDFYINNERITANTLSSGKQIINCSVYEAEEFRLANQDNSFYIELGTVEPETPELAEYLYSINGKDWITIEANTRIAKFSDLTPGTYDLRFKMRYNQMESNTKVIKVIIRPYWWASVWAVLLYILLLAALIIFIYRQLRIRYLAKKAIERNQHAMEINNAKLQFFTNISHEIKTPLSLIVSPLQKLIASDSDPKRQESYRTMHRNTKMLIQLINQLIDIRKIDNGRLTLSFHKAEVISLINEISASFEVMIEEKNLKFTFEHEMEKLYMWVDAGYFDKIIMNLLSNAIKYTPNNGQVSISLQINKAEDKAVITVSDTGIGIMAEDRKHIFERFYTASNNVGNWSSNGIGLHLTHSLVHMHHGNIVVKDNVDGIGTCFVVTLPLGTKELEQEGILTDIIEHESTFVQDFSATAAQHSEKIKTYSTKNLLIVDDDLEIVKYLRKELASDFHIETCNNGLDALQRIFKKQPDIIISDVMMPELDGLTLCRKIKQNTTLNHIPVILLTAKADENTNLQGLKFGADAYITKPFYIEILRRTAINLVNMRAQMKLIYSGQQMQEDRLVKMELDGPNKKLLDRIMNVVNENISNPNLSIDMLCDEVGISRAHIYRKLKELTNQSGRDFIKNIRLKYAETLLLEDNFSISEIAEKVGFTNPGNFSSTFKEKNGLPPLQWREKMKKKK